jgi:hypothetical protein
MVLAMAFAFYLVFFIIAEMLGTNTMELTYEEAISIYIVQ